MTSSGLTFDYQGNRSVTYFNVVLLILCWLADPALATAHRHTLEARQSSDGCGQNPLVALLSYAREFSNSNSTNPLTVSPFLSSNHHFSQSQNTP